MYVGLTVTELLHAYRGTDKQQDRFQLALRSDADAPGKGAGYNRGIDLLDIGWTAYTGI
jgi:hypothetical protein